MLYAWVDGIKRAPLNKGEKTICQDCGGILTSVVPTENIKHWRHKAGDCDNWSEPEGQWHLSWKEYFDFNSREICLIDEVTGELHRADVLCGLGTEKSTVLELQHSNISEEERIAREEFYSKNHKMFWLVHIHSDTSFNEFSFGSALSLASEAKYAERKFMIATWGGRSYQFIEKWKRSNVNVFFDWKGYIFYLASDKISQHLNGSRGKGRFAVCSLSRLEFINAINGVKD
nr:hypothetical protein [uncultured Flavobacterium sp.]